MKVIEYSVSNEKNDFVKNQRIFRLLVIKRHACVRVRKQSLGRDSFHKKFDIECNCRR